MSLLKGMNVPLYMKKRLITEGASTLSIQQIKDIEKFEEMFRNECDADGSRLEKIKEIVCGEKKQKHVIESEHEFLDIYGVSRQEYNEGFRKINYHF